MMHFQKEISKRESSGSIQNMNKPVCYGILGNSALTFRSRMKMHLRDKSVCFKRVRDYARSGCGSAMIKRRLVLFTSLKYNVWFIALLLLFSRIAAADTDVFLPISQSKISQEEAESILIGFLPKDAICLANASSANTGKARPKTSFDSVCSVMAAFRMRQARRCGKHIFNFTEAIIMRFWIPKEKSCSGEVMVPNIIKTSRMCGKTPFQLFRWKRMLPRRRFCPM